MSWPVSRRLLAIRERAQQLSLKLPEPIANHRKPPIPDGKRFDFLVVLYERPGPVPGRHYACRCERMRSNGEYCGTRKIIRGSELIAGRWKSCGCLQADLAGERLRLYRRSGR